MIQLGDEAGESLRIEVTLLPDTRTIEYEDGEIADHEGAWLAGRDGPPGDHASRPRCR
jgi:hypothetical protein